MLRGRCEPVGCGSCSTPIRWVQLYPSFLSLFILHWLHSLRVANQDALLHVEAIQSAWAYLIDAQFWFESFQNWQSEFLSTAVLVVLSIVLHKGSPESKPVAAPQAETGA